MWIANLFDQAFGAIPVSPFIQVYQGNAGIVIGSAVGKRDDFFICRMYHVRGKGEWQSLHVGFKYLPDGVDDERVAIEIEDPSGDIGEQVGDEDSGVDGVRYVGAGFGGLDVVDFGAYVGIAEFAAVSFYLGFCFFDRFGFQFEAY